MTMDWTRCIICQNDTSEVLRCPLSSSTGTIDDKKQAYIVLFKNIQEFKSINALPVQLNFENETVENLIHHCASWHKSCHLKFSHSKLQRAKIKKREKDTEDDAEKRSSKRKTPSITNCIFCEKGEEEGNLHEFSTFDADRNVRSMAAELQDTQLLSRIAGGDLIAIEAKYHLPCLVKLRNRYRTQSRKENQAPQNTEEKMKESIALVELTTYIEKTVKSGTLLFKLSELHSMFMNRLENMGVNKMINKTRLKSYLLDHFPDAQEQHDGRNTIIIFKDGMRSMLRDALKKRDFSEDAAALAKAATIIRKDIFNHQGFNFSGAFPPHCQEDSLPTSLKSLISMILKGTSLKDADQHDSQACLTAAQTILYNTKKWTSEKNDVQTRHTLEREPPLPIYIGINIHAISRSKKLIQQLYQMGLSISYDRVMELEEWLATSVCERFEEDGVVLPACLRKGLFTVGALDNLDHNPSSTTSLTSLHGTAVSLFQFPTESKSGESLPPVTIPPRASHNHCLPEWYASVPAVALKTSGVQVPTCHTRHIQNKLEEAKDQEEEWIKNAIQLLDKEKLCSQDAISWAAYHASLQPPVHDPTALCALLPLFYEKAATPAMIKHGMDIQRQATEYLNPGQIPVTTVDQPLFALAKLVQWNWPDTHGEGKHVVMLGGLHTEMALWSTLGDILDGSGWTSALTESEVASAGVAESLLKSSHLTRTRHAHQVTVLSLKNLQHEAFMVSPGPHDEKAKDAWLRDMREKSATFMYWDMIMRYETLILIFIRAHREMNFPLYVAVLKELTPLFFALDHVNYSRWTPIHIRDMESLPDQIKDEFEMKSHWVLSKTSRTFSAIPFDQAHEQENKIVKGTGGAVGLTENPVAFRRWMLSGPELARLLKQFEGEYLTDDDPELPRNFQNHEQGLSAQLTFQKQVSSLSETMRRMGSPFLADFEELIKLDNRVCVDESVRVSIRNLEETGKEQYKDFVTNVIVNCTQPIQTPIKRNSLAIFKYPKHKAVSKQGKKVKLLQNNVALFGQLYVSMQNRESDLQEFFSHEVQSFPPSLSDFGKLHLPGSKSDLLKCLQESDQPAPPHISDCRVFDGATIVHSLPTAGIKTFDEYSDKIFFPFLQSQLRTAQRVDIVWDTYVPDSLKEFTREKRGQGVRRKVIGQAKIPGNWMDFLRDSQNKQDLFAFLTSKVRDFDCPQGQVLYITSGESVVSQGSNVPMPRCNHEEADTRIIVHVIHALDHGATNIHIRTVDTDVIVILVGQYSQLVASHPDAHIWVAFGMGKSFRYYSINSISSYLGEQRSKALPVFHAFSGCDQTSAFYGKGKKSAWQAWQAYEEVTETLFHLAAHPFEQLWKESTHFRKLERFTVILYDRTSASTSINETRMELFCHRNCAMEKLPPTQDALLQHARRAVFQAGIWCTSHQTQQVVPSPGGFGWVKEDQWIPVWITIPEVSAACSQLIKCSCKGGCVTCKCGKANLDCTPLCKCKCRK